MSACYLFDFVGGLLITFCCVCNDTAGCNNQACSFRDSYAGFTEEGYAVYGLSADKTTAQAKWQTKVCKLTCPLLKLLYSTTPDLYILAR